MAFYVEAFLWVVRCGVDFIMFILTSLSFFSSCNVLLAHTLHLYLSGEDIHLFIFHKWQLWTVFLLIRGLKEIREAQQHLLTQAYMPWRHPQYKRGHPENQQAHMDVSVMLWSVSHYSQSVISHSPTAVGQVRSKKPWIFARIVIYKVFELYEVVNPGLQ